MNEQLDKLVINLVFALLICLFFFIYRSIHKLVYPSTRSQLSNLFHPEANSVDTIHLFSRMMAIGLALSSIKINLENGIFYAAAELSVESILRMIILLLSIYIMESITLYNFDYSDEVHKRKNLSYSIICLFQAISLGLLTRVIFIAAQGSLVLIVYLWLLAMVILGLSTKLYKWSSVLTFNRHLIQKDIGLALSFGGFVIGLSIIIIASFAHPIDGLLNFATLVVLDLIKTSIAYPLIHSCLIYAFRIQRVTKDMAQDSGQRISIGIYEGIMFIVCCLITSVILSRFSFGEFYSDFSN